MKIARTIKQIKSELLNIKDKKVALIPTMGSLHEGHLSLINEAKKYADFIIVTIFVNKTQFNNSEDFNNYPRNLDLDIIKLNNLQVDLVFAPQDEEIFCEESEILIKPKKLADCLCGLNRKGHFDGVCLIISKFFNIIKPDFAIFGKKDFQQYLIIKKMVRDLNFDVKVIGLETVREESGLAMSSRNERLTKDEKDFAKNIFLVLNEIKSQAKIAENLLELIENKKQKLLNLGFDKVDYLEIRSEENLSLITKIENEKKYRIFVAVYLNKIRLIDNLTI